MNQLSSRINERWRFFPLYLKFYYLTKKSTHGGCRNRDKTKNNTSERELGVRRCGPPTYWEKPHVPPGVMTPELRGTSSLSVNSSKGHSQPIPRQDHCHNSPWKYIIGTHRPSTPGSVSVTVGLPMNPVQQEGPWTDECQRTDGRRTWIATPRGNRGYFQPSLRGERFESVRGGCVI